MKYYEYEIRKTSTNDLVMSYDNLHDLILFLKVNQTKTSLNDTTLNFIRFYVSQKGKYVRKRIGYIVFNNETTKSINDLISRLE